MIFKIKRNDRKPSLLVQLLEDGSPVDLTGCTVRFIMKAANALTAKVNAVVTIVSAGTGIVRFDWGATDTDTSGVYKAEWEITDGAGLKRTIPNEGYDQVHVIDDLG